MGTMATKIDILKRLIKWVILGAIGIKVLRFILFFQQKLKTVEITKCHYPIPDFMKNQLFGYIFGTLPTFTKQFHREYNFRCELFDELSTKLKRNVDTIQITTLPFMHNAITTRDPVLVKHILKDDFDSIVKPDFFRTHFREFLGSGIFIVNHGSTSSEHKLWSFQRKTASKIFTKKIFNGHVYNVLLANTDKLINILKQDIGEKGNGVIELKKLFYAFTLDAIGDIGFGVDFDTLSSKGEVEFANAFDTIVKTTSLRLSSPIRIILGRLMKSERDLHKSRKVLDNLASDLITERRNDPEIGSKGDILSLFIQADASLSDQFLRDIIMSFMIAGRDTSACTLSFLFYLLATHQLVQNKLWEEIDQYFQNNGDDTRASLDMLQSLPYLQAVVLEALRLFPPVPIEVKEAGRATTLPGGVSVPKGTLLGFEVFVMGRDPKRYDDPGTFKPERWLGNGYPTYDQYEFPVFQAGNRFCLGKDLALFEIKVLTIELLRRFKFLWPNKDINIDAKDVGFLDGVCVYQVAVTLSILGKLPLKVQQR